MDSSLSRSLPPIGFLRGRTPSRERGRSSAFRQRYFDRGLIATIFAVACRPRKFWRMLQEDEATRGK
jgi:hypothetical protein